jgi:O-antigen ligase
MIKYPNRRSQFSWNCTQIGLAIFPLLPALGAVALGLALLITWLQQYRTIIRCPLNQGFALLSVLLIISAAFAYNKTAAFLGLFNFLPFFILFAGFSALIQTPAHLRRLSWIIVINSLPVVILGLGQLFLGWTTSKQWESIFGWSIAPGGNPVGRMSSALIYANILGGYLAIVFILGLGLWLEAYRKFRAAESKKRSNLYLLILLTITVIGDFAGLILTNSRNAWAIALIACLVYALYQGWRILVNAVIGVGVTVLLAAFAPSPIAELFRKIVPAFFWARLNDQMYPDRPVVLMRSTQWEFAWSMTQQRPMTGWGLRNFTILYLEKMQIWLGHPHNFFLMLSAEAGLPATILFCGFLGWILITAIQWLRESIDVDALDKLIFFSYLLSFGGWIIFNTVDVTLFDFRLNVFSWLLLSAIWGVGSRE